MNDVAGEWDMNLAVGAGYFIVDNVEVGANARWRSWDELDTYSLGGYGEFNVPVQMPVVPFVGGRMAYTAMDNGEDDNSAFEVAGYAGVKFYVVASLAIGVQGEFMWASDEIYVGEDELEDTDAQATLFTRFYF